MAELSKIKQKKQAIIDDIEEKIDKAKSIVLVNYIGLNVEEVSELRNQFRALNVEYKVMKNTMISRAAQNLGIEGLDEHLHGTTAIAFSYEDPTAGPKVIKDFIKKSKKTEIKCGLLGKDVINTAQVEALASVPNKETLVAMLLSVMNGPIRGFATALNQIPTGLVRALNAVKEQK
ncbi:MAG: 50S ribosomal protein L10 [Eubacteriales bacterium]